MLRCIIAYVAVGLLRGYYFVYRNLHLVVQFPAVRVAVHIYRSEHPFAPELSLPLVFFFLMPERFNQFFWLCGFTFFFTVDHRDNSVAMHDFFHLRRRNEITFLRVDFQEAKAFFCGFYHPFSAWRLGMQLLFKLR